MCTKPCKECPYRSDSIRGYFGGQDGELYYQMISSEQVNPCHQRSEYGEDDEPTKVVPCRGQMMAQMNSCKSPRNPEIRKLMEELKDEPRDKYLSQFNFKEYHQIQ